MPLHNEKSRLGKRFTPEERAMVLDEVSRLDGFGYSQQAIIQELWNKWGFHVSQGLVCYYLKKIKKKEKEDKEKERDVHVNQILKRLRQIRNEAYIAWQESKKPIHKRTHEKGPNGKGFVNLEGKIIEQRLPPSDYLKIIMDCDKREAELLGLDAPKTTKNLNYNANATVSDTWKGLLEPPKRTDADDIVQRILQEQKAKQQITVEESKNESNGDDTSKPRKQKARPSPSPNRNGDH